MAPVDVIQQVAVLLVQIHRSSGSGFVPALQMSQVDQHLGVEGGSIHPVTELWVMCPFIICKLLCDIQHIKSR